MSANAQPTKDLSRVQLLCGLGASGVLLWSALREQPAYALVPCQWSSIPEVASLCGQKALNTLALIVSIISMVFIVIFLGLQSFLTRAFCTKRYSLCPFLDLERTAALFLVILWGCVTPTLTFAGPVRCTPRTMCALPIVDH